MSGLSRTDLLFAKLALQLDLVDREVLLSAMQILKSADPGVQLAHYLVENGGIDTEANRLVEELVKRQLEKHDSDADKSIASLVESHQAAESLRLEPESTVASGFSLVSATADPGSSSARLAAAAALTDRFSRKRLHAKGGRGAVYEARDLALGRTVAVKEIQDQFADNEGDRLRFLLEAEITGQLEHPGIVPVYELGTRKDGRPFYVMRLIHGESLRDAIQTAHGSDGSELFRARRTDLLKLLRHFVDICNTVDYAHSKGVIHRDIKPQNVMLGNHGETMVVDWGLAKFLESRGETDIEDTAQRVSSADLQLTEVGSRVGTPAYMSPEQAAGDGDHVSAASDVYGLGATLYYLLTNQPPQTSKSTSETLERVRVGDFPAPRSIRRHVPHALDAICLKAMALDPADRYPSARELSNDIDRWIADEPVSVAGESWAERSVRWMRRHRQWTVAGIATLVLLTVSAVVFSFVLEGQKQRSLKLAQDKAELAVRNQVLAEQFKSESETNRQLAQDNSKLAEQRQAALLESFERLAERDMQRGDWQSALATVDQALADNPVDRLKLLKAHILLAMHRGGDALSILNSIETDDRTLQARIHLVQGDIRLGQDEDARTLIQEAVPHLTEEVDQLYAAALLTDDCVQSAEYLRNVVVLQPYHLRANQLLTISLFFLGQKNELGQRLITARAFFPDDPSLKLVHAMLMASDGNTDEAKQVVRSMRQHLGSNVGIVEMIVDVFAGVNRAALMTDQERDQFVNEQFRNILIAYGKLKLLRFPFAPQAKDIEFVVPPSLDKAYGWIKEWEKTLANPLSLLGSDIWETISPLRFMEDFQTATEVHPEGTVHWLLGTLLLLQNRQEEAVAALRKAVVYPSIVNIRPFALKELVPLEMELSQIVRGAERDALVRDAMDHLRLLWQEGGLRSSDLPQFALLAIAGNELDVARQITLAWEIEFPDDPAAAAAAATVAMNSGAYVLAVDKLDKALARHPNHSELSRLLPLARQKLDEAARRYLK